MSIDDYYGQYDAESPSMSEEEKKALKAAAYGDIMDATKSGIGGLAGFLPDILMANNQYDSAKGILEGLKAAGVSKAGPELTKAYKLAESNLNKGFTSGEEGRFKQDLANRTKEAYSRALINSGGNQSQAIWAALKSGNLDALNKFAVSDANIRRSNQDKFTGLAQAMEGNNLARLNMHRQDLSAAGRALASANYNKSMATRNMGNFIRSWFGGINTDNIAALAAENGSSSEESPMNLSSSNEFGLNGAGQGSQWDLGSLSGMQPY